jgi:predicted nucleic acid-binding protein
MRLFLDTNIIIDVITQRSGYEDSLQIIKYCEAGQVLGCISATTVTNAMYILRKHLPPDTARRALQTLFLFVDVADVLKSDITAAFACGMKDFEDAVQAACAERIKAEYIVTRNVKDFAKAPVSALLPRKMLEVIRK